MLLFPYVSPSPPFCPCPQVYFLCLFLHGCPVSKFFSTIFLDSVYMLEYNIYLSLSGLLHSVWYILGSFTSLKLTQSIPFYGWVICHCVYVPQLLYPFICWWASRSLPSSSYCKYCYNENGIQNYYSSFPIFVISIPPFLFYCTI